LIGSTEAETLPNSGWERSMPNRIITPATFDNGKIHWFALGKEPVYFIIDMQTGSIDKTLTPGNEIINMKKETYR
jgi:hypothetical protein